MPARLSQHLESPCVIQGCALPASILAQEWKLPGGTGHAHRFADHPLLSCSGSENHPHVATQIRRWCAEREPDDFFLREGLKVGPSPALNCPIRAENAPGLGRTPNSKDPKRPEGSGARRYSLGLASESLMAGSFPKSEVLTGTTTTMDAWMDQWGGFSRVGF